MIQRKKKKCRGCGKPSFLWGSGMCKYCYFKKIKPPKKINKGKKPKPVSSKRQLLNLKYGRLRKKFLRDHPACEIRLPDCTGNQELTVHHSLGREGNLLLNTKYWFSACMQCHTKIHSSHTAWAYENGFLIHKHQTNGPIQEENKDSDG